MATIAPLPGGVRIASWPLIWVIHAWRVNASLGGKCVMNGAGLAGIEKNFLNALFTHATMLASLEH
jgi:hypothetical protein